MSGFGVRFFMVVPESFFSIGAGPAAQFQLLWGSNGYQFNLAVGIGFGLKADIVDLGFSKSY